MRPVLIGLLISGLPTLASISLPLELLSCFVAKHLMCLCSAATVLLSCALHFRLAQFRLEFDREGRAFKKPRDSGTDKSELKNKDRLQDRLRDAKADTGKLLHMTTWNDVMLLCLTHFLLIAARLSCLFSVVCYYVDTYPCMQVSQNSDNSLYEVPFERLITSITSRANIILSFFACLPITQATSPPMVLLVLHLSVRSLYSRCLFRVLASFRERSTMSDYT